MILGVMAAVNEQAYGGLGLPGVLLATVLRPLGRMFMVTISPRSSATSHRSPGPSVSQVSRYGPV